MSFGFAGAKGLPVGTYGNGLGRGFIVGYRRGAVELEAQLDNSYRLSLADPLRGQSTEGVMSTSAGGLRFITDHGAFEASVFLGAGWASAPIVALIGDQFSGLGVASRSVEGVGGAASVGIGANLSGLRFELAASAMLLYWETSPPYVIPDAAGGNGRATYHTSNDQLSPMPFAITLSFREQI